MRKALMVLVALLVMAGVAFGGYAMGVRNATTAEGWLDGEEFLLEVDGNIYVWDVSEE